MARLFDNASSQFLENANAVATAAPLTIAGWFRSDDAAADQMICGITNNAGTGTFALLIRGTVAGDPVTAFTAGAGNALASTTTGFSANTWHHGCAVFAAANDRAAYIDGGSKGTNTASQTPSSLNTTAIGRRSINVPANYMSGRIAEVAIWNVALNDTEVAALARGIAPPYIRPASIIGYWPVWGLHSPEIDLTSNNRQMTVTGATLANHAPVQPYSHRRWMAMPVIEEAAAGGQPTMRRWGGIPGMAPGRQVAGRGW